MKNSTWSGRFKKGLDKQVLEFSESVSIDHLLFDSDIRVSLAHAEMLGECKIITKTEAKKLCKGLQQVKKKYYEGKLSLSIKHEDVHMNIEQALTKEVGELGKKIHMGRSRNDLVFPYDLINGNEVGDWFSRTVAMTMSKHNGWLKFGLDKLNQTMYPQDNSKGFIGKLKKWIYLIIAWIDLIISQIVWMYNTTSSYFTGWGPVWSNMWLFSDIYPNSFIFHNIPFLTSITSALLITITSTYQYLTGFAFLAFSAYFSSGNAFNYATDEFQSYFSFKGIVFSLLIITAISLGFNCWSDCIENRDKAAADIFGRISLGICAISAFFVYYHEGKELVKKSFVKAVLKKKI